MRLLNSRSSLLQPPIGRKSRFERPRRIRGRIHGFLLSRKQRNVSCSQGRNLGSALHLHPGCKGGSALIPLTVSPRSKLSSGSFGSGVSVPHHDPGREIDTVTVESQLSGVCLLTTLCIAVWGTKGDLAPQELRSKRKAEKTISRPQLGFQFARRTSRRGSMTMASFRHSGPFQDCFLEMANAR